MDSDAHQVDSRDDPGHDGGNFARGAAELDEVNWALAEIIDPLFNLRDAVQSYNDSDPDVRLPPKLVSIADGVVWMDEILSSIRDIYSDIEVIESGIPVADSYKSGAKWRVPLRPGYVSVLSRFAKVDSVCFRLQDEINRGVLLQEAAERDRRHAAMSPVKCSRSSGTCSNVAMFWPGKGFGPSCRTHLGKDEVEIMTNLYRRSVEEVDCRTCGAERGSPCQGYVSRGAWKSSIFQIGGPSGGKSEQPGVYSPVKRISGVQVHIVRLEDFAEDAGIDEVSRVSPGREYS